jgi:hypothetical protein
VKYPKNPNQAKVNPEFFSKKVGEKLMKLQTMEEMLDESCDLIRKAKMTPELKQELQKKHDILMKSVQKAVPTPLE